MEPERDGPHGDEHTGPAHGDCRASDSDQHAIASDLHARPADGYPCSADEHAYPTDRNADTGAGLP